MTDDKISKMQKQIDDLQLQMDIAERRRIDSLRLTDEEMSDRVDRRYREMLDRNMPPLDMSHDRM